MLLLVGATTFSRPSAEGNSEEEDEEYEQERAEALADARSLKQLAVDYLHPELPVVTSDPTACGRNYFSRASAEEYEEKDEEREMILEELKELKKLAVDYLHPELPVATSDPTACGRNYFSRPSAPEQVPLEDADEEGRILQDLQEMKKLAEDYLCPEKPVQSSAGARGYFDRASADGHAQHIHTRKESIDAAMDNDNALAYHEHVLGLVAGEDDYHDHSEHFDMDMEGDLQAFKDNLRAFTPAPPQMSKEKTVAAGDKEEEGNLSRSPSSVMLFELAGC